MVASIVDDEPTCTFALPRPTRYLTQARGHPQGITMRDGVLRAGGASAGADAMVDLDRRGGKAVYFSADEIPAEARVGGSSLP